MARPKKANPKKPAQKAVAKPPAKKPVKKLAKKTVKPVAKTKKLAEDAVLNQRFLESLVNLEKYWSKKVATVKKQLETLQAKHDKASSKGTKTAKSEIARKQRQEEIAAMKQELSNAKLALGKFTALSKAITQFERDWLKNLNEAPKAKATPAAQKKKSSKTDKQSEKILKSKISQTTMPDFEPEAAQTMEPVEDEMDDLEDIFMPQDDISEFEVIEDFSAAEDDDFDDYNN